MKEKYLRYSRKNLTDPGKYFIIVLILRKTVSYYINVPSKEQNSRKWNFEMSNMKFRNGKIDARQCTSSVKRGVNGK